MLVAESFSISLLTDVSDNQLTENAADSDKDPERNLMQISYLEIVTPDVDAVCTTYSQLHGVTFGDGDPALGGARVTKLACGGTLGVRAPLHAGEKPVVRPYVLVEDIAKAVAAATEAGADLELRRDSGLLLTHTMKRSQSPDKIQSIDANYSSIRIAVLKQ